MNYLFSKSSLSILESLSFTNTLYAFDFDGTLAPIVKEPGDAKMRHQTEVLFRRLSEAVPTAVVSGRGLSDLKGRIPSSTQFLIGNHGLEGLPRATPLERLKEQVRGWLEILNQTLGPDLSDLGVQIEDKEYSLALHYRKSRKRKIARARILESLKMLDSDPRIMHGKMVYNVLSKGGPHKGDALLRLMPLTKATFGFYVGDDDTDEDVFGLGDHQLFTVRVGNRKHSQAKYFIRKQSEIDVLLQHLLRFRGIKP